MPIEIKNKTIETLEKEIAFLESENVRLKAERDPLIDIWETQKTEKEKIWIEQFRKTVPFFDSEWNVDFFWNRKGIYIQHKKLKEKDISWSIIEIDIRENYSRKEKSDIRIQNSIIRNEVLLKELTKSDTWNTAHQRTSQYAEFYKLLYLKAQLELIETWTPSENCEIFEEFCLYPEKFSNEIRRIKELNSEIYKNEESVKQLKKSLNKEKTSIIEIFLSSAKENQYVLFNRDRLEKVGTSYEDSFAFLIGKQTPKSIFVRDFYIHRDSRNIRMNSEEKNSKENYILRRLSVYNELLTFKEFQELIGQTFEIR